MAKDLPPFARVRRDLPPGRHPFLDLLPGVAESPALVRISAGTDPRELLVGARVRIEQGRGFAFVDAVESCIVLVEPYYRAGDDLDLYLLHELTHLRQRAEGRDLWDRRFCYVDRPTEIEGYAVAVEEGRRLGMSEADLVRHLSNPWMTAADVQRLLANVNAVLLPPVT